MTIRHIAFTSLCASLLACAAQQAEPQAPTAAATEATQPELAQAVATEPAAVPEATSAEPAAAAPSPADTTIVVKDGLSTPESVLYDAEADVYLVSNINGAPLDLDDNGFISKIGPDGAILELKWIDGAKDDVRLSAPKGMTITGGVLYVTDIDTVRKFDAKTGEPKGEIAIKGATFLNDLASDADGTVFVTDSGLKPDFSSSGSDAIYKIVNDKAKPILKSKELKGPNGVFVDEQGVWVGTFSANEVFNVKTGRKTDIKTLPNGGIDGIAKTADGRWLVSSWGAKQVLVSADGVEWTPIATDLEGPADIGYDSKRNRLLVPVFMQSVVKIQPL